MGVASTKEVVDARLGPFANIIIVETTKGTKALTFKVYLNICYYQMHCRCLYLCRLQHLIRTNKLKHLQPRMHMEYLRNIFSGKY
jgi:hypothetical protein